MSIHPRSRSLDLVFFPTLLVALLLAGSALAQTRYAFYLDPARSFVQIEPTSEIVLDLPVPLGTIGLPLVAQSGPSTSGNVVPGIGLSDGTQTALEGAFVVDIAFPFGAGFTGQIVPIAAPPLITPVTSGLWLPGDGSGPIAGDLAAEIALSSLGLVGEIVLRDLALAGFEGGGLSFVSADEYAFPAQPFSLDPVVATRVADGSVIFRGLGFESGVLLSEGSVSIPVPADSGTLTRIGPDDWELAITFTAPLRATPLSPGPIDADIDLTTTIVATTLPVPEPGAALGLGAGIALLGVFAQRRRASAPPRRWRRVVLCLGLLAIQPACDGRIKLPVWPDSNADGMIDEVEAEVGFSEGEGTGATSSAASDQIDLGVAESGQALETASCNGDCPGVSSPFALSSGCGSVEVTAEPTGFGADFANDCTATTGLSAQLIGTQFVFNQSSLPKSFFATLRTWASDDADLTVTATVDGLPLVPNVPLAITLSGAFESRALPIGLAVAYAANSGASEAASVSIEIQATEVLCQSNTECGPSRACVAGTCIASGFNSFCFDSADCVDPYVCVGSISRCQEPLLYPNPCNSVFDCEGSCINSQCSEGMLDQPCDVDDDCDMSAPTCISGFCS